MNESGWLIGLVTIAVTLFGMQAGFGAWISNQFYKISNKMDKSRDTILDKLEYHERHDDRRFGELGDDIWEIRLRLATLLGFNNASVKEIRTDRWPPKDKNLLPNEKNGEL